MRNRASADGSWLRNLQPAASVLVLNVLSTLSYLFLRNDCYQRRVTAILQESFSTIFEDGLANFLTLQRSDARGKTARWCDIFLTHEISRFYFEPHWVFHARGHRLTSPILKMMNRCTFILQENSPASRRSIPTS